MSKQIDRILAQGVIAGLLAPVDQAPTHASRPWPLTVFTGFGAWFAAIPFAVMLYLITDGGRSSLLVTLCAIVVVGATAILRVRPPLFVEQLALAGLVASTLVLYFHIAEHGSRATAALTMFVTFAAAAALVPQTWLRVLFGTAMGITGIIGMYSLEPYASFYGGTKLWVVLEVSALWCLLSTLPSRAELSTEIRAGMEAVTLGMSAAIICSPFWMEDPFFLFDMRGWSADQSGTGYGQDVASVVVTLASAALIAWKWAPLRAAWFLTVTIVMATFAWFIPSLCVLALIGSVALITGRKSTAILCCAMLIWWIGSFYFSLQSLLIFKAMLLAASGGVLGLTVAFLCPVAPVKQAVPVLAPLPAETAFMPPARIGTIAFVGCAFLTLSIANVSIFQKEAVARTGTTLFVALAPVDPRSLMQGDYMRLSFRLDNVTETSSTVTALVGVMDEHGIWTVVRSDNGMPLSAGEIKINLSGTPDHPIFVTDAWFFKEGEATRWQGAGYGEFRVKPDGTAVLIGLRGKNLESL